MTITLSAPIEEELRELAARRGRAVEVLVEEAVRTYLEAAAVSDLDAEQVAETQMALIGELSLLPEWKTESK